MWSVAYCSLVRQQGAESGGLVVEMMVVVEERRHAFWGKLPGVISPQPAILGN